MRSAEVLAIDEDLLRESEVVPIGEFSKQLAQRLSGGKPTTHRQRDQVRQVTVRLMGSDSVCYVQCGDFGFLVSRLTLTKSEAKVAKRLAEEISNAEAARRK